jgi:type II secretory pathway component PulF
VSTTNPATIADLARASRYLLELCATVPFDEAVERVRDKADAKTAAELDALQRYVRGESAARPARELSLYADFLRTVPDAARAAAGVRALNESLADARHLADATRAGLPVELSYSGLLLLIAATLCGLWLVYLAPAFSALLGSFGASLPALSRAVASTPWLIFAPIAMLAVALVALARAGYRQAAAIENLAPLEEGWVKRLAGTRAARAHERWRLATLASARIQAGVPFADAIRAPVQEPHADGDIELERDLRVAAELGLAAHEIEHQRQRSLLDYRGAIELRRMVSMRVLQIAVAAVLGAIVIAIYQPIFRMGAVI